MIIKQLTMIYDKGVDNDTDLNTVCFKTWKGLHMHLFENGLYPEFQVFDNGKPVLHYDTTYKVMSHKEQPGDQTYKLTWDSSVPGSVLFEIVNRHASAQL